MPTMATKKKGATHGGERSNAGRPARADGTASRQYAFRLGDSERDLLTRLAAALEASESEVLRRGLVELAKRHGVT